MTGEQDMRKLQSNYHHQQTNTQVFTAQMSFLSHNYVKSLKEINALMTVSFCSAGLIFKC